MSQILDVVSAVATVETMKDANSLLVGLIDMHTSGDLEVVGVKDCIINEHDDNWHDLVSAVLFVLTSALLCDLRICISLLSFAPFTNPRLSHFIFGLVLWYLLSCCNFSYPLPLATN